MTEQQFYTMKAQSAQQWADMYLNFWDSEEARLGKHGGPRTAADAYRDAFERAEAEAHFWRFEAECAVRLMFYCC